MRVEGSFVAAVIVLPVVLWGSAVRAEPLREVDAETLEEKSLGELLDMPIDIAERRAQTPNSSAAIVTVITRAEIMGTGARDLLDVLRWVPGLDFGADTQGVVGLGVRGNWVNEGKALVLVDGHELNETLFNCLQFGNRIPVDQIQRIEIIRGPGSVVYGGFAELAVINVITRRGFDLKGAAVYAEYGQLDGTYGHRNVSLGAGYRFDNGAEVSVSGALGQGQRSAGFYESTTGEPFAMKGNSDLNPGLLNVKASWRGLDVSYLYENYRTTSRDAFGEATQTALPGDFVGHFLSVKYDFQLGDRVTLTPKLNLKRQTPYWSYLQNEDGFNTIYYEKTADRFLGGLHLQWVALENVGIINKLHVIAGAEAKLDHAWMWGTQDVGLNYTWEGATSISYHGHSEYAQAHLSLRWFDVSVGARYEWQNKFGGAFVPRFGLLKELGFFHAKLLISGAYKTPSIENIALNPAIEPERTWIYEAEIGYRLTDTMNLIVNAYDLEVDKPIVYLAYSEETGNEGFTNYRRTGTRGVEAQFRFKHKKYWATLSYAFYTSDSRKAQTDYYNVPGVPGSMVGFPHHKVTLVSRMPVPIGGTEKLFFSPTAMFVSSRYGQYLTPGDPSFTQDRPRLLLNAFVEYQDLGIKGLHVGAGVSNLLNERYLYIQGYGGGHPPIPDRGREYSVRVMYEHRLD